MKSGFDIEIKCTEHLILLVEGRQEEDRAHETPQYHPTELRGRHEITRKNESNRLPDKIMINVHPQRWHDRPWPCVKELVGQNVKNVVKAALIKIR